MFSIGPQGVERGRCEEFVLNITALKVTFWGFSPPCSPFFLFGQLGQAGPLGWVLVREQQGGRGVSVSIKVSFFFLFLPLGGRVSIARVR